MDALKERGRVWLVNLPDWVDRGDHTLVRYRGWGEVEPEAWDGLAAGRQEVPSILFRACRQEWESLQQENAPLRAVVNGTLMGVPETFYDHVLQWALDRQPEEVSVGHLLAEALSRQLGIGDGWFALRAEKLIQDGILTVVKEAPLGDILYRRIVRKTQASQSFVAEQRKKMKFVFRRDMCVPENSSRPVSVPEGRAQQAAENKTECTQRVHSVFAIR